MADFQQDPTASNWRCPNCGGTFERFWQCGSCRREYAATLGIPDLRWPPVSDPEEQRLIVNDLLRAYARASFDELCRLRVARLAKAELLERYYTQYRLNNIERGARMARMFQTQAARHFELALRHTALDIGCGSGAAALALCDSYDMILGIDWNLADLLLFRKRLEELQIHNVSLAQANLLRQPIADNAVDYATALNVIEHMLDVARGFSEIRRVLHPGGCFCGDSRNRFDVLFPEPHVKLRLVGFLPRHWAEDYVCWRRKLPYKNTRLLSYWELHHTLKLHFDEFIIAYPDLEAYRAGPRTALWLKQFETRLPTLARLALPFFTTMVAVGYKRPEQA
jgi:ubiquinone/menaquinone biosynthesis C-methylase UbiE